ncbi:MAG: coenzyme A pyrophosphatase [Anaerolineaceae bacterium]|nr:coenzyme A pyrophosphatase [Anaerolineaceae bacterium]
MKQEDPYQLIRSIKYNLEKNHKDEFLPKKVTGIPFRQAAVLAPFVLIDSKWHLLFTRRSDSLKNHKGQVSFPGGAMDQSDQSPIETAFRETYEEIGVGVEALEIIGKMEAMMTNSNFLVTPVLAVMKWPVQLVISEAEVSKVFTIPLNWLADSNNWEERIYNHPNGWYGSVIFYQEYGGELLWGITAAITHRILKLIK